MTIDDYHDDGGDYHDEKYQGVRQPVTSNPALRLYKYSVYDGKVCLFELIMWLLWYECDETKEELSGAWLHPVLTLTGAIGKGASQSSLGSTGTF